MKNENDIFELLGHLIEYHDCGLGYGRIVHISRENLGVFAKVETIIDGFQNTKINRVLLKNCRSIEK